MKTFALRAVTAIALGVAALFFRVSYAERPWLSTFARFEKLARESASVLDFSTRPNDILPQNPKTRDRMSEYLLQTMQSTSAFATPNLAIQYYRPAAIDNFAKSVLDGKAAPHKRWPRADTLLNVNPLPALQIQKMLLAVALARAAGHDSLTAERLLEASWQLNADLRSGHTLIEQLVAIAAFRYELLVMRKIDCNSAKWLPRIHAIDFMEPLRVGVQLNLWHTDVWVHHNSYASPVYISIMRGLGEQRSRAVQLLRTPLRWFNLPGYLEANREMLDAVKVAPRSERIDAVAAAAYHRGLRKWLRLPDPLPEIDGALAAEPATPWGRALRTTAERELTERVLEVRAGLPFHAASSIENAQWICERTRTDLTIRLSRKIQWGSGVRGTWSPLEYRLSNVESVRDHHR